MDKSTGKNLLLRVLAYYQGKGEYDFSGIENEQEKANALNDAWQAIVNEIEWYLQSNTE